jgi:hypothetical protein
MMKDYLAVDSNNNIYMSNTIGNGNVT